MTDHTNGDSTAPDWELAARHIAGEGDAGDRARMESFLRANPADAELLRALDTLSRKVPAALPSGLDVESALRRTRERRDEASVVSLASRRAGSPRPAIRWVGLAAAAAVALVFARNWLVPTNTDGTVAGSVYRGTVGQVDSVRLADGSVAMLAPGATLTIPAGFPAENRSLRLEGQGWFRATHEEEHPFTVLAGDAVVRDIGTVFSVRSGVNGEVRVAVHEGAVAVRGTGAAAEVQLSQGDEVMVAAGAVQAASRGTVPEGDADWTSGRLHFRDVSMEEFSRTVASWTGWVVRLEDPELRVLRVTQDLTLAEARQRMEEAALVLGARVTWKGDTAVVSRGGGR
ncbi:MAG: FecR domain-containing protein [Gemmatimonadetes bacterium]|nr:FecR domain-containing protein [Gemmatimonadota bacterium]